MPALEPTVPAAFHAVFGGGVATGNLVDIEPEAPQTAAVEANLVLAGIEAQGQGAVTVESDEVSTSRLYRESALREEVRTRL